MTVVSACPREPVRLQLLDGFRLEVGGRPVESLLSAQRLMAFLALRGPAMRASVAGVLWAEAPEVQASACLRTTMWRVNRTVPDLVSGERSRLALADFVRVDVADLVDGAATVLGPGGPAGDTALLLRRPGELLPGWYDDWVIFERERLRHLRLHALEAAAARFTAAGEYAVALDVALEAVRSEPLRESAHRAVIAVHLAENNVVEAWQALDRFRDLLREQLGLEPSEQLVSLVGARIGDAAAHARVTRPG